MKLEETKRIIRERGIHGVHGPVMDLISCKEQFATAVETVGGGR